MPIRPPIRYPEAWRMLCDEGVWRPMRGPVAARRGNVESQNLAMLRMGRRLTRHPRLGAAQLPYGSLLVTTENKAVAGRRELMGSRRAL